LIQIGCNFEKSLYTVFLLFHEKEKRQLKLNRFTSLILLTVILSSLVLPLNMAFGTSPGNVHGTVVDEDGPPIEDVKVSAYLGTGSLEEIDYTNKDGYFRMNLGGTYTFVFEKTGYITLEKNVQVTH
jgi:hypothetical protein